jgi:hypothetical protein
VAARLVTNDGRCYPQKMPVPPPIEVFKLASERPSLCHHPNDAREARVCLVPLCAQGVISGAVSVRARRRLWVWVKCQFVDNLPTCVVEDEAGN